MLLSRRISFLSILTVLCVLCMLIASFLRTNTIFFTLFSSVFVMLGVYEHKISGGLLVYAAASLLGFFLVPDKSVVLFFAAFFGFYPVLKALIERLGKLIFEWIIKIFSGSVAFFAVYYLFINLFSSVEISLPVFLIYILATIVFVVYDLALSFFLSFYLKRIRPKL